MDWYHSMRLQGRLQQGHVDIAFIEFLAVKVADGGCLDGQEALWLDNVIRRDKIDRWGCEHWDTNKGRAPPVEHLKQQECDTDYTFFDYCEN